MPITETWGSLLGVEGSAGWNKFGSFEFPGQYGWNSFTISGNSLQMIAYGDTNTSWISNQQTWHGLTPDVVYGSYKMQYTCDGLAGTELVYFTVAETGGNYLWVRDGLYGTLKRQIGFKLSLGLGSNTNIVYGTTLSLAGKWAHSGLSIAVTYGGSGTWEGTFSGTCNGTGTNCVVVVSPTGSNIFTPTAMRHGIRVNHSLAAGEEVTWTCTSFTLPYTRCEWTSPSEVMFIGTWYEGGVEQVGYLPLGDRLLSCSDIVDYAYAPLEYRGWSSSCNLSLADNDKFFRDSVLGYLIGTEHLFGRFVVKKSWDGSWSTLFSGYMSEQPVYDYVRNTVDISLESPLSSIANKYIDVDRSPFTTGRIGGWGAMYGLGTYSVYAGTDLNYRTLYNDEVLYPYLYEEQTITIDKIVDTIVLDGTQTTKFTIKETLPQPQFYLNQTIYGIRPWPVGEQVLSIRENPAILVESILANAQLSVESDDASTQWASVAAQGVLGNLPTVSSDDKVVSILNEVCAALNTAYTVSPEGRIRLFSIDVDPSTVHEVNLGEHYSKNYTISLATPISEVSVDYGFDDDNNGPDKNIIVSVSAAPQMAEPQTISSRFLSDNVSAMVMAYRAARRYEGAVPVISLEIEGSSWLSIENGHGVQLLGAGNFLGSAAPLQATWLVVNKVYNWTNDTTALTLISRYPAIEWVCWGSSIPDYNRGKRWF